MERLVGRTTEISQLVAGLDAALAGSGGLFLVTGEAGIGKTALAKELTRAATERGFTTLSARGWDGGGAPAFWPFIQVFRKLVRDHEAVGRAALDRVPGRAAKVAELAPDVVQGVVPPPASPADSGSARFALFDAAATWLQDVSKDVPLLLLLEDLHGVDPSTLSMLLFVAHELGSARVVIVGTYRERSNGAGADVLDLLAKLARDATMIRLPRLAREDVAALIESAKGAAPPAIAELVYRTSEGVPLFVEEILRSLSLPGAAFMSGAPLPTGVRTVIRDRLARLDEDTQRELAIASVVGTRFTLALVGLLSGVGAERVHELVERAVSADVLERIAPGRYAFAHTMIREALYREIPGGQRAQHHAAIAEAIEQGRAEGTVADRAYHALRAAPILGVARAVGAAREAADAAMRVHAFEDAAELLRRALAVMDVAVEDAGLRPLVVAELAAARARSSTDAPPADAALGAPAPASKSAPPAPPAPARGGSRGGKAELARDGDRWTVTHRGAVVRIKDSRGVQMLAQLLERPGEEVHSVVLCASPGAETMAGDSGEVLDREAIDAYRERLVEVEEELREAEAWNDPVRAERARTEMELLRSELSRAVGLGGRSRRAGSDAERARVNAQRRLREAIRRVGEESPEMGRHLERTVKTGSFCSYVPLEDD